MQPIEALKSAFNNYVNFSGRASRGDYWWYVLAYMIGSIVLSIVDAVLFAGGMGVLSGLWALANIIPLISAGVRRLHDGDRSGWWYLLAIVPIANLYLLYLFIIEGTKGENRFGPDSVPQAA